MPKELAMLNLKNLILSFLVFFMLAASAFAQHDLKLWYKQPAKTWTEAMPVGNGRLGAMIHGGVNEELILSMKKRFGQEGRQTSILIRKHQSI